MLQGAMYRTIIDEWSHSFYVWPAPKWYPWGKFFMSALWTASNSDAEFFEKCRGVTRRRFNRWVIGTELDLQALLLMTPDHMRITIVKSDPTRSK